MKLEVMKNAIRLLDRPAWCAACAICKNRNVFYEHVKLLMDKFC